jgi:hypothetical protein
MFWFKKLSFVYHKCLDFIIFSCFGDTGVSIQSSVLVRQALYHLSLTVIFLLFVFLE